MHIYQPPGDAALLFDGDWDGLTPWAKHEVRIKALPPCHEASLRPDDIVMDETCEDTGSLFAWVGTAKGEKNGSGHIRTLVDDICLDDFLGNAIEIKG